MSSADDVGLPVGSEAPDVSGTLVHPDGRVEKRRLSSLLDEEAVLLTFYTNDFSPDCIREWCSFRDFGWFTATQDLQVVGVSKSRVGTHKRFIDYLDLDFPLFADRNLEISKAFGVDYRVFNVLPRARRSCFFIDQDGVVRYKWIGEHPLDPTRDTPPIEELHDRIKDLLGE